MASAWKKKLQKYLEEAEFEVRKVQVMVLRVWPIPGFTHPADAIEFYAGEVIQGDFLPYELAAIRTFVHFRAKPQSSYREALAKAIDRAKMERAA